MATEFGTAFRAARSAGKSRFKWKNKEYTTRQKGESKEAWLAKLKPKPRPSSSKSGASRSTAGKVPAKSSVTGRKPTGPKAKPVPRAKPRPELGGATIKMTEAFKRMSIKEDVRKQKREADKRSKPRSGRMEALKKRSAAKKRYQSPRTNPNIRYNKRGTAKSV